MDCSTLNLGPEIIDIEAMSIGDILHREKSRGHLIRVCRYTDVAGLIVIEDRRDAKILVVALGKRMLALKIDISNMGHKSIG